MNVLCMDLIVFNDLYLSYDRMKTFIWYAKAFTQKRPILFLILKKKKGKWLVCLGAALPIIDPSGVLCKTSKPTRIIITLACR